MSVLSWGNSLGNRLFGPDPKLEFRRPGQGVDLLAGPSLPVDAPYWRQYLTLPDSASDLPLLLPSSALLAALHSNPSNLATLVHFCASTLFASLATPGFPTSPEAAKETLNAARVLSRVVPLLLGPQGVDAQGRRAKDELEEAVFWTREEVEPSSSASPAKEGGENMPEEDQPADAEDEGQFVLEDDEDDEEDSKPSDPLRASSPSPPARPTSTSPPKRDPELLPPLAVRLISAVVDLLFVPGFTLPEGLRQGQDGVVTYAIWEPGIASPPPSSPAPPPPVSVLTARLTLLRLLTLLISLPSLLTPPHLFPSLPNRWRDALTSARAIRDRDRNVVLCLLCSVVNTAFQRANSASSSSSSASSSSSGAAGGVESLRDRAARLALDAARTTPAQALDAASSSADDATASPAAVTSALEGACVQFLAVALVEHAPPDEAGAEGTAAGEEGGGGAGGGAVPSPFVAQEPTMSSSSSSPSTKGAKKPDPSKDASASNLFASYLSRLHRPSDLQFLLNGLLGPLTSALAAPAPGGFSLPLPGAAPRRPQSRPVGRANELLAILWRLVEGNRKFAQWVVKPEVDAVVAVGERAAGEGRSRLLRVLVGVTAVLGEWREDETQLGLLRLATFLLQTLTSLLALSVFPSSSSSSQTASPAAHASAAGLLSAPMSAEVPGERMWAVVRRQVEEQGVETQEGSGISFVEFLVITLHALFLPSPSPSARPPNLSALHPSLLLLLSNLSPFVRELGPDASTRLVRVWLAVSAPGVLVREEGAPRLVFYLLETFNNIVHYNLDSNPHLLHALLLTQHRFTLLSTLTLSSALAEARRLKAARKARLSGGALGAIPEGQTADGASGATLGASDKALGKRRERTLSTSSLGGFSVSDLALSPGGSPSRSPSLGSGALSPSEERESMDLGARAGEGEKPFVGRGGFVPTEEWVASWREGLPLSTLLSLLQSLSSSLPQPLHPTPSSATLSILRTLLLSPSLTALLPSLPPSPKPRRFQSTPHSTTWLASLVYGRLYLTLLELYLRDLLPVQLFAVAQAPGARLAGPGGGAGLVGAVSEGLGKELERAGKTAVEVGGRVGGIAKGLLGGFGGGGGSGSGR
ncbi:hypothetical protein JCM8097_008343 [Rhodosporidiobolus ruineniae]